MLSLQSSLAHRNTTELKLYLKPPSTMYCWRSCKQGNMELLIAWICVMGQLKRALAIPPILEIWVLLHNVNIWANLDKRKYLKKTAWMAVPYRWILWGLLSKILWPVNVWLRNTAVYVFCQNDTFLDLRFVSEANQNIFKSLRWHHPSPTPRLISVLYRIRHAMIIFGVG